jgi:glutamate racemase
MIEDGLDLPTNGIGAGGAAPVGMLDSGVGGLSILREFHQRAPSESIVYFADQAHLPYGEKSIAEIRGFVRQIAAFLIEQGCKMLILPCNAANAAALRVLRAEYPDFPIIGMEPAIKPAAQATKTGVIGVLTTRATYQGELFASVIDRFARDIRVEAVICPQLVLLAEQGAPDTAAARAIVRECLAPLLGTGADQIVLGCTHFPFLAGHIRAVLGEGITIVDPGPAVARQAERVLKERALAATSNRRGTIRYMTSGDPARFESIASRLIRQPIHDVRQVQLDRGIGT